MDVFSFNLVHAEENPFRHFSVAGCLDIGISDLLLAWLENGANWQPLSDEFYNFYGVNLRTTPPPASLSPLTDDAVLAKVHGQMEKLMDAELGMYIGVAAQKMTPGCHIGVHTDFGSENQTHRLVIQLNRGWNQENGGILMMFDEESPVDISGKHRYYLPRHRMGVGFQISARSFHAVSPIVTGERYTLCLSFSNR